ncbi:MAG: RND transporter, partial [Erythrobacter sp.]|nr:RND transporter [Erythrobacter sp.]
MKPLVRTALIAGAVSLALSGCASGDSVGKGAVESARAALPQVPERWRAIATAAGPVENGWVRAFDDPRLLALVEEAQARSTDLQTAVANVQQAR